MMMKNKGITNIGRHFLENEDEIDNHIGDIRFRDADKITSYYTKVNE